MIKNFSKLLKHFFVPHRENAYRPHAFRHHALGIYSLILIVVQLFATFFFVLGPSTTVADSIATSQNIIERTNLERQKNGLNPLAENLTLERAAQDKLNDMFAKNYWDHTGPNGETAWQFIEKEGYPYQLAGENLAKGFADSGEVVSAWMASPEHRENILNKNFSDIGVAVGTGKINGVDTSVMVQLFGQPQTAVVAGANTNVTAPLKLIPEISLINAASTNKIPYLSLWFIIFALVIIDGILLKRLGLEGSKPHRFKFRFALITVLIGISLLSFGFAAIV